VTPARRFPLAQCYPTIRGRGNHHGSHPSLPRNGSHRVIFPVTVSPNLLGDIMPRPYASEKRIPRHKPTTLAARKEASGLRRVINRRRSKKAVRLAALARLDIIAPRKEKAVAEPKAQA
jgi:hypothetical protein